MSIWHLIIREIVGRKLQFALGVLSVLVAVGCLVAELTLLRAHELRTAQIMAARTAAVREQMQQLEDDYRKITLKLGFNVLILPKDQNLGDLYAEDYAAKSMPEAYVQRLAQANVMTVAHLLPVLQEKVKWPERARTILLIGTQGEVPIAGGDGKKPLIAAVKPGSVVLGYELHRSLGLNVGDTVALLGKRFTVSQCNPERGNKDDITAWIDLRQAQQLLRRPGVINAIFALSCQCEGDRLATIRKEIARVLPDTQVVEFASQAVTRAEARLRAEDAARQALATEKASRDALYQERVRFAAMLIPLVLVGCIVWVGLLAFSNTRERRAEIGLLRALGLQSAQILWLFLGKAVLVGITGAVLGYLVGLLVGVGFSDLKLSALRTVFTPALPVAVLVTAPALAALASWFPALLAAEQDPAEILQEE